MPNHHALTGLCVTCGQTAKIVMNDKYPGHCQRCYHAAFLRDWRAEQPPKPRSGCCEDCGRSLPFVRSNTTERKLCRACYDAWLAPRKQAGERRGWSSEMLEQLQEHYPTATRSALLAMFPGRSWDSIQHAAARQRIARFSDGQRIGRPRQPTTRQTGVCAVCGESAPIVASALAPGCCEPCYKNEYRRLRLRQRSASAKNAPTGVCASCGNEAALVRSSVLRGALCYACYHVHYQQTRTRAGDWRKEWMPDETAQLIAHFEYASREELLALFPGRTWNSICAAAQRRGVSRRNPSSNISPAMSAEDDPAPVERRERLTQRAAAVKEALHDLYVCERNTLKWLQNVSQRAGASLREGGVYGCELSE